LHELWWTPGDPAVSHGDITANASAPDAEGSPVAFAVDGDRTAHLVYRGDDDHVHEISWV
ncbi:MAG: hypothetical protein ACRCYQ_14205, partial [Nocardioides sp.]